MMYMENIHDMIRKINISLDQLSNGMKIISERLNRLTESGFYIESVVVHSQAIEYATRFILESYKLQKEIAELLNEDTTLPDVRNDIKRYSVR